MPFFLCPDEVQDGSLSRDLQPFSGGKPKEQQSGKYLHNNNIEQHSYTLIEMSFKSDVKADSQTVFKRSQQASKYLWERQNLDLYIFFLFLCVLR